MIEGENALEKPEDAGKAPKGTVSRWLMELKLADKEEANWRDSAKKAIERYRLENRPKTSNSSQFPILWANTEVLRPALYNSMPRPDVRRRFRDADKLGKCVSEVMERCLAFSTDEEDFDGKAAAFVLDMLLSGRGVVRIRYVPNIVQVNGSTVHDEQTEEPTHEAQEGVQEELAWESCPTENVHWENFRRGPGRTWAEVRWIAFRHKLTRAECQEKFGDLGKKIPLEDVDLGDDAQKDDNLDPTVFKRATVWEIWDKDERQVVWISKTYPDSPLLEQADPLELQDFFPVPRPLYAIETIDKLVPITLYSQYMDQARDLDKITARISKIIGAIKARGLYDATLTEMARLRDADDGEYVAAENSLAISQAGGLDKFIWSAPIEDLAKVLQILGQEREAMKAVVYEITGIGDVMRGMTNPNETLGAQQMKANFGTQRLQRLQREVQRFIRDIMRLKAEIIGGRFQPQTIQQITGLQYPMLAQKQQAQSMLIAAQKNPQMAQQMGRQLQQAQELMQQPAWEEVFQVMKSDAMRAYRIDIETDSTIQNQLQEEQQNMTELLSSVVQFIDGIGPAVQSGSVPIEVAKSMLLAAVRRFKMGREVEDALDKIQPPPPPQPEQDNSAQVAQIKAQSDHAKMQADSAIESAKISSNERIASAQIQADREKAQSDAMLKARELDLKEQELAHSKADLELRQQDSSMKQADMAHRQEMDRTKLDRESPDTVGALNGLVQQLTDHVTKSLNDHTAAMAETVKQKPAKIQRIRDKAGRMVGAVIHHADGSTSQTVFE